MVDVLFWSPATPARSRQTYNLTIGTPAVFLLDVRIKSGIRQVLLVTVLTIEVSAPIVIFRAALSRNFYAIRDTTSRNTVLRVSCIILARISTELMTDIQTWLPGIFLLGVLKSVLIFDSFHKINLIL